MLLLIAFTAAAAAFGLSGFIGTDSRPWFDERPEGQRFGALR
jgi:hypothetical protein